MVVIGQKPEPTNASDFVSRNTMKTPRTNNSAKPLSQLCAKIVSWLYLLVSMAISGRWFCNINDPFALKTRFVLAVFAALTGLAAIRIVSSNDGRPKYHLCRMSASQRNLH